METLEKPVETNTDFEVRSLDAMCVNESQLKHPAWYSMKYVFAGILFGIVLVKSEAMSWFRIQEMFRFEAFHMYGLIGSAVAVGALSVWLIKRFKARTIHGEAIVIHDKPFSWGVVYGGLLFGVGWAITGACPGPLFAQVGTGVSVVLVTIASAIGGTYVYGLLRERLPH